MTLAKRQALMAKFLDDPFFERRVRQAPEAVAGGMRVELEFVQWLLALDPKRIAAFRRSQNAKAKRRGE